MTGTESYTSAWRDFRRRRRICYLSAGAFLLAIGVAGWLEAPENVQIGILVGGGGLMMAAAWWAAVFPCPRCRAPFNGNVLDRLFEPRSREARKCAKCGLPVDGGPDDAGSITKDLGRDAT